MIQNCLQCDRPMHLRGGDMTTTCAECREKERHIFDPQPLPISDVHPAGEPRVPYRVTPPVHPLPRSEPIRNYRVIPETTPHDLDARALKARVTELLSENERLEHLLEKTQAKLEQAEASEEHQGDLILRLYRKIEKHEAVAEAARPVLVLPDCVLSGLESKIKAAVEALDAKEGT